MAPSDDPPVYNPVQQRFALNMMANAVGLEKMSSSDLVSCFYDRITTRLPNVTGGWELTWGPAVYKQDAQDLTPPENAWFVATSADQKMSVLAIAGTAASSDSGWMQDANIKPVIDWEAWMSGWTSAGKPTSPPDPTPVAQLDKTRAYIASGTAHGTANILTNQSTQVGINTYVHEYLASLPSDYTIYITGHSMGGALSPAVALGLVQAHLVGGHEVIVLPTAGASPGNDVFSSLWSTQFPKSGTGIDSVNADFYNQSDLVPQAWGIDINQDRNIHKIFGEIYANVGDSPIILEAKGAAATAILDSRSSGIVYRGIQGEPFPSTTAIPTKIPDKDSLENVFVQQHIAEYYTVFGIADPVPEFTDALKAGGK